MGKKTSVYLSDDLAEAVAESGLSLADLISLGLSAKPRLVEEPHDEWTWTTWWFCDAPASDERFSVLREEWLPDASGRPATRKIYEIKVTSPRPDGQ